MAELIIQKFGGTSVASIDRLRNVMRIVIETRRLSASVHIGGEPGEVLLTPDEEYALVISRDAGDVAVVRMRTVLDRSVKTKPLLTMFPMGGLPQSTLIIPKEA